MTYHNCWWVLFSPPFIQSIPQNLWTRTWDRVIFNRYIVWKRNPRHVFRAFFQKASDFILRKDIQTHANSTSTHERTGLFVCFHTRICRNTYHLKMSQGGPTQGPFESWVHIHRNLLMCIASSPPLSSLRSPWKQKKSSKFVATHNRKMIEYIFIYSKNLVHQDQGNGWKPRDAQQPFYVQLWRHI